MCSSGTFSLFNLSRYLLSRTIILSTLGAFKLAVLTVRGYGVFSGAFVVVGTDTGNDKVGWVGLGSVELVLRAIL